MTVKKPRARKPRVTLEVDSAVIAASKALVADGHSRTIEIIGPPFGAWVHSPITGTDRYVPADEAAGLPGSRMFAAWVIDLADEHDAALVMIDPGASRHAVEHSSLDALTAGLKPLTDAGLEVIVNTAGITAPPAPTPPPALTPLGEPVAGGFAIGEVRDVPAAELPLMPALLASLGRDATVVSYNGPDRLEARRQASAQRDVYSLRSPDQAASDWLREVVLSHEPRLLIVEHEAAARADLDLTALTVEQRIAVGVLPGPSNPGHTTPESIKEAL